MVTRLTTVALSRSTFKAERGSAEIAFSFALSTGQLLNLLASYECYLYARNTSALISLQELLAGKQYSATL